MNEINEYTEIGFDGFVKVSDLRNTNSAIPSAEGVYIVVRRDEKGPEFLAVGTGGHFKGKNPNVAIEILKDKVVKGSQVIYIGKATDLRKRISQLLRFGAGANVGHWGGRYLWQLSDADNLLVAWKETPGENPEQVEKIMLAEYHNRHGALPFANLKI